MPVGICPHCHNRYVYDELDVDHVHTCHGSEVLSNEDRPRIDEGGYNLLALANKRGGKLVNVPGVEKVHTLTSRGNRNATHKPRQYYEHIELEESEY